MQPIRQTSELEALYGDVPTGAKKKVIDHITPLYRTWIDAARFVVLTTVGPEGTDGSPRGEDGPVVKIRDQKTLLLPDWRGNNRIDSLRNLVSDGRLSLMFMIPGVNNVVRINGTGFVTADEEVRKIFTKGRHVPKTVVVVDVQEAYFQCAKALMRSALWGHGDLPEELPTAGDFIREQISDFDSKKYDAEYPDHARERMW